MSMARSHQLLSCQPHTYWHLSLALSSDTGTAIFIYCRNRLAYYFSSALLYFFFPSIHTLQRGRRHSWSHKDITGFFRNPHLRVPAGFLTSSFWCRWHLWYMSQRGRKSREREIQSEAEAKIILPKQSWEKQRNIGKWLQNTHPLFIRHIGEGTCLLFMPAL